MSDFCKFIVFEGLDNSGKSTHSKALVRRMQDNGQKVVWTCEPGSPLHSLNVRDFLLSRTKVSPKALELLFMADRAEHNEALKGYIENDYSVVADRSFISGVAYAVANGFEFEDLTPLLQFVGVIRPTVIIYLDIPSEEANSRRIGNGLEATREEDKPAEFQDKLAATFKTVIETMKLPYIYIDGTKPCDEIVKIIDAFIG